MCSSLRLGLAEPPDLQACIWTLAEAIAKRRIGPWTVTVITPFLLLRRGQL